MPRVLLVHQPVDGGVGRHVRDLAVGLAGRGCEVILCGPAPPVGVEVRQGHIRHVTLDLRRSIAPGADVRALRAMARLVRETRPDLIHAHSSKAGALARLVRVARPRVPVLYTPHGYAFAGFFERSWERCGYRVIERALAPLATRVVCVCEAEARLARTIGPSGRVRVVYNGIEPPPPGPVDPLTAELGRRGPVVCVLTQLRAGKGIETLIDALPSVLGRHPDAQIAVWGDGPERETLQRTVQAAGLGEAVRFPGASDDPLAVLRGADLFVHPSLAESFPYVVLEAMAVARPIVASAVGGVGEALTDGGSGMGEESGLLVAPGDSNALARAIVALLDDADRRKRMGEAARKRLQRCFTIERMLDRLIAVYGEVAPAAAR